MDTEKTEGRFPLRTVRISIAAAAVMTVALGLTVRNQSPINAGLASLAASLGNYDMAQDFLNEIDAGNEEKYYKDGAYHIADAMLKRGDYDLALERFSGLGDYADSKDKACECILQKAEALMNDGDYQTAINLIREILYYDGSQELYKECQYRMAKQQIDSGEWLIGIRLLWSIRDYKDAKELAQNALRQNYGTTDISTVVNDSFMLDPEVAQKYVELSEKREKLREGAIAVGFYHTVGLSSGGSVLSCGNNERGQCDTAGWDHVTQVAAGAYHTVALRDDGTVLACGDNTYGQCDVSGWKDVVQIAASDYNTAGLLSDGRVVTCGFNKWTQVEGWNNIARICSGSYSLSGISLSGELVSTHRSCLLDGKIADAAMSTSYAVGLDYAGKVVSSGKSSPWSEAIAVYAGGDNVGIIDADGKPHIYNRRQSVHYSLPSQKNAVGMSLGGTHFAVLYDDGSVHCDGDNAYGQCDTGTWNLG